MRPLSLIAATLLCSFVHAQISVLSTHMPVVGDTFHLLRDNTPAGFSVGQAGPNRTWDFSSLNGLVPVTTYAISPGSTPYSADYPNANLVLTNDFNTYVYYGNTASALKTEGFAANDANLGLITVNLSPVPDQHKFPTTYLTNFAGTTGFMEAKNFNELPANIQQLITDGLAACPNATATVQQVRVTYSASYKDTIDAWGKVITPVGEYDALRRKRVENTRTIIEVYVNCIFPLAYSWIAIADQLDTTTEHSWLTTITKIPVVSLTYDSNRVVNSVTYSTIPPAPIAGFTWDNPSGGTVDFTNTSKNSPETYAWDFGDGNSSNQQNPSHVYAGSGTYNVCLTVTNMTGTDTHCANVTVTVGPTTVTVSGKILSEEGDGVRSVTVDVTESESPQNYFTAPDGIFTLTFNQGDDATVTPAKANDTTTNNGITTLDIIFIQRHILGTIPLSSPYKLIAADVNNSKTVTTLDIVFIRSLVLQMSSTFLGGRLWEFTPENPAFDTTSAPFDFPKSRIYTDLSSDLTDQNFIGMKLGDVNNSWDPTTAKAAAVGTVAFGMEEQEVTREAEIIIPVKVKNFNDVTGYQFTVSWNPEVLAFADVSDKTLSSFFGRHRAHEGFLTISWNDEMARGVTLDDHAVAFELKFKAIGEYGTQSEIKIGSELTLSEAYNGNLDFLEIRSTDGMVKIGDVSALSNLAFQSSQLTVNPNPFSNNTTIAFTLAEETAADIMIYDITGKEVRRFSASYPAGENRIVWAGDDAKGSPLGKGLYHVRMTSGAYFTSAKLLLAR